MQTKREYNYTGSFLGVIKWSVIRHKYLIPAFTVIQMILAVAIVYGLSQFLSYVDDISVLYLSSGAVALGIIAVGCVLAPQIVSEARQNGILKYQRTLPVSRISILLADIIIWGLTALPGIVMSIIASMLRFQVSPHISLSGISALIISLVSLICIGFCIAYWLPPTTVSLVTQLIMFGGLLFSPIVFPESRLPEWSRYVYKALPFVSISKMIRTEIFQAITMSAEDVITVVLWGILTFVLALVALGRRQ